VPATADYWDDWFARQTETPVRDQLVAAALGLPKDFPTNNLLPWSAAAEMAGELRLRPGDLLLDLACGRGGWGLELAQRTCARLVGVDWSTNALSAATRRATTVAPEVEPWYCCAAMTDTALRSNSVDAVLCLDSIQFAYPPLAAVRESHRVLRPGRRVVFTWWEPLDPDDPIWKPRMRERNLGRDLDAAGFTEVQANDRADWHAAEQRLWQRVADAPATDDMAMAALKEEAALVLPEMSRVRRVLATATKPVG